MVQVTIPVFGTPLGLDLNSVFVSVSVKHDHSSVGSKWNPRGWSMKLATSIGSSELALGSVSLTQPSLMSAMNKTTSNKILF